MNFLCISPYTYDDFNKKFIWIDFGMEFEGAQGPVVG